jgi:GT2 family glycosyltransferase
MLPNSCSANSARRARRRRRCRRWSGRSAPRARWCPGPAPGRRGPAASRSGREWLWFLHADSRPDAAAVEALAAFLGTGSDALAYFDLRFAKGGPALMRLTEYGAGLRCRWFGLPFGDQGFLIRRERFYELGGFDESRPYGEDHALVWAARRAGLPVMRIPAALTTSARRYAQQGWWSTTLRHQWLTWQQAASEWRAR